MQKGSSKPRRKKQKVQEDKNPFDDIFFWLTLATTDFSFGLFENNNETKPNNAKQTAEAELKETVLLRH